MHRKYYLLLALFLASSSLLYAQDKSKELNIKALLIPALIALVSYIAKSGYDIYIGNRKRKRELLENKLKSFYWPIYVRLKENENTYLYLFAGKKDKDEKSTDYIIAHHVEKNVLLKNHIQILELITQYRHLADSSEHFEELLTAYIKHVTIYKALTDAGINEYPGVATDAPYPRGIDEYFHNKTKELQKRIEKMRV